MFMKGKRTLATGVFCVAIILLIIGGVLLITNGTKKEKPKKESQEIKIETVINFDRVYNDNYVANLEIFNLSEKEYKNLIITYGAYDSNNNVLYTFDVKIDSLPSGDVYYYDEYFAISEDTDVDYIEMIKGMEEGAK